MFEKIMLLKGYDIDKAFKEIIRLKSFSNESFENWKQEKRWAIVRYHLKNNAFYKNLNSYKIIKKWTDLPVLQKSNFQLDIEKLLSDGFSKNNTYFASTSGSSGHPFLFAKDYASHSATWGYIKWRYLNLGISLIVCKF